MGRVMELRKKRNDGADTFLQVEGSTEGTNGVNPVRSAHPESKSSARSHTLSAREPGDLDSASPSTMADGRQPREGRHRKPRTQAIEESDEPIVSKKSAKTRVTPVEPMEGRAAAEGKSAARNALPAQDGMGAPTSLQRIRKRAKQKPKEKWTNLLSHIREPLLKEAYHALLANPLAVPLTEGRVPIAVAAHLR